MKAIAYKKFGSADVLEVLEEIKPMIQPDQVLVKIKAFSINPMDWKIRKGEMKLMSGSKFPKNTGADFAGIVEEVGLSVTNFKIGDEVFGVVKNIMKDGASAECVAASSSLLWKKPDITSFAQAASLLVVGTAAATAIEKMGVITSKTTILINGATGGFGMLLLQLLNQMSANVTAVTSTEGIAYAKKWGANTVIDYKKEDVLSLEDSYDIIIDLSGKMGYEKAKPIMKPKSIFINPIPKPIEIPLAFIKNLFTGKKHITLLSSPETRYTNVLLEAVKKGLDIKIHKVYAFHQYKEAYGYAEKGGYVGKVVVELNNSNKQ